MEFKFFKLYDEYTFVFSTVLYLPLGRYDVKTAINEGYGDAVVEWIYSVLENAVQAIRKSKDDQITIIFDINHLMYSRVTHIPCKFLSIPISIFIFVAEMSTSYSLL